MDRLRQGVLLMRTDKTKHTLLLFTLSIAFIGGSCAPIQPTNPAGPRGNEPVYPVLLVEDNLRREAAEAAIKRLNQSVARNGNSTPIEATLRPITATIESLQPSPQGSLYLPKIGSAAVMNEEETRESLRRFIRDWRDLIGSEPARLSLVEHTIQRDGTSVANYEQRPFRFPIRGDYGKLQIRSASDRRVLSLSSTCIPDADKLRGALRALGATGGINARLTADDAIKKLREKDIPFANPPAASSPFNLPASAQLTPRELVTHIQPSKSRGNALEFHLAWEIEIGNAPVKLIYLDSLTGDIIAAE